MSQFLLSRIATVLRDFVISGVASSGEHEPIKAELRGLLAQFVAEIANEGAALSPAFQAEVADLVNQLETLTAVQAAVAADAIDAEFSRLAAEAAAAQAAVSRAAADIAAEQAIAAAEASGDFIAFDTKALAVAGAGALANGTRVRVWQDESQSDHQTIYVKEAGVLVFKADLDLPAARLGVHDSRALAEAQFIPSATDSIRTAGFAVAGDGGEALYERVGSEPTIPGYFESADGSFWQIASPIVRPEMFGLFTDETVTRATLLDAFTFASEMKRPLENRNPAPFTIDGSVTRPWPTADGAELRLILTADMNIVVDPTIGATLDFVIYFESATVVSHSISGPGRLYIDCSDKAAFGVFLRHTAAEKGGRVVFDTQVKVENAHGDADHAAAAGIFVIGRFAEVIMRNPEVNDVTRDKVAAESGGIVVSDVEGLIELHAPVTRRILLGPGTGDADGVKTFTYQPGVDPERRTGRVRVYDPIYEDCQGRSHKDQSSGDCIIYNPRFIRDGAVLTSMANAHEVDFQMGGGCVYGAQMEYRVGPGDVSPLGASFRPIVFQSKTSDAANFAEARGITIRSDVAFPGVILEAPGVDALDSLTVVSGINLIPTGGLATSMITDAIFKMSMANVIAKPGTTSVRLSDINGPNDWPIFGYDTAQADMSTKLSVDIRRAHNPLGPNPSNVGRARAVLSLSGTTILEFRSFNLQEIDGYCNLYTGAFVVDFTKIPVGCTFSVDIAACNAVAVNPPPWGAGSYGHIRCLGQWFGTADRVIEVQMDGGSASPSIWRTQNGGDDWYPLN